MQRASKAKLQATPDKAFLRYEKTWKLEDLDHAITHAKAQLDLAGKGDNRQRALLLNDLGRYLLERYFRSDYDYDAECTISTLQEGVAFAEQAVALAGPGDPLQATYTSNLAALLLTLWGESPDSTENDLRKAVDTSEAAVRLSTPDSPDKYLHHIQLAEALQTKALAYGDISFLQRGIVHATKAEQAVSGKHAKRGLVLSKIAELYIGKFRLDSDPRSKELALKYAVRAFEAAALDSVDRDRIFLTWARITNY